VYRYADYWLKLDNEWKKREPAFPDEVADGRLSGTADQRLRNGLRVR
jgi:hypothetical protein